MASRPTSGSSVSSLTRSTGRTHAKGARPGTEGTASAGTFAPFCASRAAGFSISGHRVLVSTAHRSARHAARCADSSVAQTRCVARKQAASTHARRAPPRACSRRFSRRRVTRGVKTRSRSSPEEMRSSSEMKSVMDAASADDASAASSALAPAGLASTAGDGGSAMAAAAARARRHARGSRSGESARRGILQIVTSDVARPRIVSPPPMF